MSGEIAALEAEVKEYTLQVRNPCAFVRRPATEPDFLFQLETVQLGLQADPDNTELQSLKTELEEVITLANGSIAQLRPAPALQPAKKPSPQPVKEKWSKENHPAYQAGYKPPPSQPEEPTAAPVSFKVNDTVSARWKSGDGSFYPARITSITGSSSNPVYIVTFKSYATTETLREKDIRPLASDDSRKRKADASGPSGISSAAPTPPPPSANPSVISAAANVDPELASQARKEPSKVSDGPPRPAKMPRKVKANKELEAGKAKWQDFATKGKMGKGGKKDSMFRTPDGVNARGSSFPTKQYPDLQVLTCPQSASQDPGSPCEKIPRDPGTSTNKTARRSKGHRSEFEGWVAVCLTSWFTPGSLPIFLSVLIEHIGLTSFLVE